MQNIIWIKVPFSEAVNTFNLSDNFLYSTTFTGYYQLIPEADDAFDIYSTGGNQFTQLFFSGSGYWNGSGNTFNYNNYLYDTFDSYVTGLISGYGTFIGGTGFISAETGLSSGIRISGYFNLPNFTGYTIWSGYSGKR